MTLTEATLLAIAGGAAGALNALAGGGSFLTLPALLAIGMPPVAANATGTVALLPGYLSASWGSRADLPTGSPQLLRWMLIVALCGGALGAALLMLTPDHLFADAAPWLVLGATLLFVLQPRLRPQSVPARRSPGALLPLFLVCIYGGYFNGGLGILLLATLAHIGADSLNGANALKNRISAVLTAIAVCVYMAAGAVHWAAAAWMMLFATLGGYFGARVARRLAPALLRILIIAIGLTMAALLAAI